MLLAFCPIDVSCCLLCIHYFPLLRLESQYFGLLYITAYLVNIEAILGSR